MFLMAWALSPPSTHERETVTSIDELNELMKVPSRLSLTGAAIRIDERGTAHIYVDEVEFIQDAFDTKAMHTDARPILCIHTPGNDECPEMCSPVFMAVGDGDFRVTVGGRS